MLFGLLITRVWVGASKRETESLSTRWVLHWQQRLPTLVPKRRI
jgi:hypothetical protein